MHGSLVSTLKSPSKITCTYSDENKSKFFHNASRWFMILFVFGSSEQLNSRFLLWKLSSIYKPSIGLIPAEKDLAGISSLRKIIFFLSCWSQSRRKREVYPGILNWPTGKDSSTLVFELTNTSIMPMACSTGKSILFLNEVL